MDSFTLVVLGACVLALVFFVAVGFATRNRPVAEFLDKRANERWAAQAMIEEGDKPEMVKAANEYRRRRGEQDLTVRDIQARANESQRASIEQAGRS